MARLITVLVFAAVASVAMAQGNSTSSTASTSTTVIPTPSSTMAPKTSTPSMSPTPTPTPPALIPNNTYNLTDDKNEHAICLRMVAGIAINFTYLMDDGKTNYTQIDFNNSASVDTTQSKCHSSDKDSLAVLTLQYMPKEGVEKEYYVTFTFKGNSSANWEFRNLSIDFTFNPTDFPHYNASDLPTNETTSTYTDDTLFDQVNTLIAFNQSFQCNSNRTIFGFKPITPKHSINVTLFVRDLRVQAFQFKNETTGAFGDASQCLLDNPNTGNKIVPIAVGAALAGLVIVVLIAYLIGRLRNRRKSSYEALS